MKNCITVAYHTDGKTSLVHGPDVPFTEQRNTVQGFRDNDVPEGIERVEIWSRNQVKFAYKKSAEASRRAELEALIAEEKAKAAVDGAPK